MAVALASESLPAEVKQLAALYADAFKLGSATGREIDSVTQQLAQTASLLRKLSTGKGAEARARQPKRSRHSQTRSPAAWLRRPHQAWPSRGL